MTTITYEEYLPLRGDKTEPDQLVPGQLYYIERSGEPPRRRTVYKGIYSHTDPTNIALFLNAEGKSTVEFVVNPFESVGEPRGFSIDPQWKINFYNNAGEVNKNVEHLVYTLTGKRRNTIGPVPRGQTREMGIPKDVATIMALNLQDPRGISNIAKKMNSIKHKTNHKTKHKKGGKRSTYKRSTYKRSTYKQSTYKH